MTGLLVALFLLVSVLLILAVLIQRPQGGGLSGAFGAGGAGSGQTAFGAKTGDALTITTVVTFVVWLGVAIGLVFATRAAGVGQSAASDEPAAVGEPEPIVPGGEGEQNERIRLQMPTDPAVDPDEDWPEPETEPDPAPGTDRPPEDR
ncbi:MAG: preprotein translocase subunit SecG [Phycisphaerales bacterium]|nr:MAG: preprotein translocase subunit SecG [Phycisphaerales bacterium]